MSNGILTDDEIDNMYGDLGYEDSSQGPPEPPEGVAEESAQNSNGITLYPLTLAQPPAQEGWVQKKLLGMPVWGWGLLGLGTAIGGYLWYQHGRTKKNGEDADEKPKRNEADSETTALAENAGRGGWQPGRTQVVETLKRYYAKKGMSGKVVIWHDADEAKAKSGMKQLSPLVNVQPAKGAKLKVEKDLQRLVKREGLNPIQHADGSIGLYPAEGKRGREWEEYVDALRDDGQQV